MSLSVPEDLVELVHDFGQSERQNNRQRQSIRLPLHRTNAVDLRRGGSSTEEWIRSTIREPTITSNNPPEVDQTETITQKSVSPWESIQKDE